MHSADVYDYRNKQNYNEIFICLYEKKEAIDFLFNKTNQDLSYLKDLIQPYDQTITIKDINVTQKCIYEIQKMKKIKDNNKIFNYIQSMDQNTIEQFVNYSKIYKFIINLEINSLNTENIYDKIYKIIENASFNIFHDSEQFIYSNEKKSITIDELIDMKNRIFIPKQNETIEDDNIKFKYKILFFFKEIVSKLEKINIQMTSLKNMGNILPIKINIKSRIENKEPLVNYYLDNKEEISMKYINFYCR